MEVSQKTRFIMWFADSSYIYGEMCIELSMMTVFEPL